MRSRYAISAYVVGIVVISIFSGMQTMPAAGKDGSFGGVDGTAGNPYVIEDVWDLQNMSANLSAHYILCDANHDGIDPNKENFQWGESHLLCYGGWQYSRKVYEQDNGIDREEWNNEINERGYWIGGLYFESLRYRYVD